MLSVVIVLGRAGYLFQMVRGEKTRVEDLFSLNIRLFDPSCPREQLMSRIDWVLKIRGFFLYRNIHYIPCFWHSWCITIRYYRNSYIMYYKNLLVIDHFLWLSSSANTKYLEFDLKKQFIWELQWKWRLVDLNDLSFCLSHKANCNHSLITLIKLLKT